jgi:hypothetical protein
LNGLESDFVKRRNFVKLSGGITVAAAAGIASPVPRLPTKTPVRSFELEFYHSVERESLPHIVPRRSEAVILEATMAPHLPELLVLTPVNDPQNTLRAVDDSRLVIDASKEYELRSYQLSPQRRSGVETGCTPGAHDGAYPTVSLLRWHGIHPLLSGVVDGWLVYLLEFESLHQRSKAWDAFAVDPAAPKGLRYQVRFYRAWHRL